MLFFYALWLLEWCFQAAVGTEELGLHGSVRSAAFCCVSTSISSSAVLYFAENNTKRNQEAFLQGHATKGQTRACLYLAFPAPPCRFVTTMKDSQVLRDAQNQNLRASFVHVLFPSWGVKARKASQQHQ